MFLYAAEGDASNVPTFEEKCSTAGLVFARPLVKFSCCLF